MLNKKTRLSLLAILFYNAYPNISGQAFTDSYSVIAFNKIGGDGFGFEVNFYCGIVVLLSGFLALVLIDKLGRRKIWLYGGAFMQLLGMALLSIGFFYNIIWIC